jgi:hypothetical protein
MLANSNVDQPLIKNILSNMSIEVISKQEEESRFEFVEFQPDIKMSILYVNTSDMPKEHPASNQETIFLSSDFYHNNILSYSLGWDVDDDGIIAQYRVMLSSVMEVASISKKDALFIINGEDSFFYRNEIFYLEKEFYDFFIDSRHYYRAIFQKYQCVKFDGNYLT